MSDERQIIGEPVRVDPAQHDDDHPERGGRVGQSATGTPGPEQQTETSEPGKGPEPGSLGELISSIFGHVRKVIEPKQLPVRLPDDAQWRVAVESSIVNLGSLFDRLIEKLPNRIEVAPSDEIVVRQVNLQQGVTTQLVGRQPDRLRLRITHRSANQTPGLVYLGGQGVTAGLGIQLDPDETIEIATRAEVYAIATSTGSRLDVLAEIGGR